LRALTTTTASLVLANGGVVRSVDHWGTRNLPQKMKRGDGSATTGT
jgi:small subunit ribosomal protein S6